MPKQNHVCKQNDHIVRIEKKYGIHWKTIWDDPANASLKADRDPTILFKGGTRAFGGDVITIPAKVQAPESVPLDQEHTFEIPTDKLFLRLRILKDNYSPLADAPYELDTGRMVDGAPKPYTGKTDADGKIEHQLEDVNLETALLTVRVAPEDAEPASGSGDGGTLQGNPPIRGEVPVTWKLQIGALNPILKQAPDDECVSGVQQRLNNLNLDTGPVDGILGPNTRAAVRAFQKMYDIKKAKAEEGKPDPGKTQQTLYDVHENPATPPTPKN